MPDEDVVVTATFISTGPQAVDLGLSVKWATCNVGATSPEGYGNYYAWGETESKSNYSWSTYKYGSDPTKYNSTDELTTLEAADDAATVNWGKEWRMPTDAEWTELREKCTWTWTTLKGVNGYEVKGTNGKTIFFPEAGYRHDGSIGSSCLCWSSSLRTDAKWLAWSAEFN